MLQALADVRQLPQQRLAHLVDLLQYTPSRNPLQHRQATAVQSALELPTQICRAAFSANGETC